MYNKNSSFSHIYFFRNIFSKFFSFFLKKFYILIFQDKRLLLKVYKKKKMERSITNLQDEPAAMESELYVNGKVYVKSRDINKKKKRKAKQQEPNPFNDFCGLLRSKFCCVSSFNDIFFIHFCPS
jgi:hypothetical protein